MEGRRQKADSLTANEMDESYLQANRYKTIRYIRRNIMLYIMLIIPLIYIFLFEYFPMVGCVIAFQDYNMFEGIRGSEWIGLEHFKEAFGSKDFWIALKNTIVLNMGGFLIGFPIPILLALFLAELNSVKVKKTTQVITYLPHFLSWVIIAGLIQQLLSGTGMVNQLLDGLGLKKINFLGDCSNWRWVYWLSGVWQEAGYSLIVYLAALTSADTSIYEAAYMDGAGRFKRMWYITVPMIRPTITVMLIMQLGKIVNIGFDKPYLLGNVLVKDVSNVISTHVYTLGLQSGRFDFATAIGLFQSVVSIIMVLTANKICKKLGEEGIV